MFHPFTLEFSQQPNHIDLHAVFGLLPKIGIACRAKVIKTWLNGWITFHRMHESTMHDCLLGFPEQPDKLTHYVMCPRIFSAASFNVRSTSADPLVRIGLLHPSKENLLICACTFSAYHGLKAKIRAFGPDRDLDSNKDWFLFAQHFNSEAVECGLCDTLFSPIRYDSFLEQHSGPHESADHSFFNHLGPPAGHSQS